MNSPTASSVVTTLLSVLVTMTVANAPPLPTTLEAATALAYSAAASVVDHHLWPISFHPSAAFKLPGPYQLHRDT
jgi:hypothetical protein